MSEKAIFLDRDDTLIADPGYINNPDQVQLLDGVPEALTSFRRLGYRLVLVTNQSAVARGIITEEQLQEIHEKLETLLAQQGADLDRIYYCPYHPEGSVKKYRRDSDDRKPNPGLLLRAAKEMKLALKDSWCIGDRLSDIQAGAAAGCRTILISAGSPVSGASGSAKPDFVAVNLREAVNIVKQQNQRRQNVPAPTPAPQPPSAEASESPMPTPAEPASTAPTPDRPVERKAPASTTEQMLVNLSEQIRSLQRHDMFDEFSMFRMVAGITQMVVILCLVLAVWLLLGADKQYESVYTALGFALVFQTMALTFFIIRDRR
jgi:D-glycero-D-manno-heptose 1,7-bisphosphate phosphatase